MDRGYADFGVDSTQVTIAPDKRSMYIAASVKEGDIYTISDVHLLGELILPEDSLRQLVYRQERRYLQPQAIEASTNAIKNILASIGYAYAKVTPVPKLDKDKRTVDLTLYIEPGKRVYVRRMIFQGNTAHRRRCAAPRNAPARRQLVSRRRPSIAPRSACSDWAISRRSISTRRWCRARKTRST